MMGLFCSGYTKAGEDYQKVIRNRSFIGIFVFVLGVLTNVAVLLLNEYAQGMLNDHASGFFSGVGSGLGAAGLVMAIRFWRIGKDPKKVNAERLRNKDERIIAISNKAFRLAGFTLLLAIYVAMFIGAVLYYKIIYLFLPVLVIFFSVYIISFKVLERKM